MAMYLQRGLALAAVLAAVLGAALPAHAAQCKVAGCKKCDPTNAAYCAACKPGYTPNGFGACNCAAGFGATLAPTAAGGGMPRACLPPGAAPQKGLAPCKCKKCPRGTVGAGGPVTLATCGPPPGPQPNISAGAVALPLSYNLDLGRFMIELQFGSNKQTAALVVDTGSASLYTCGYDPGASGTAVDTGVKGILGYGSSPVNVTFWQDRVGAAGYVPGGAGTAASAAAAAWRWLGSNDYNPDCVASGPNPTTPGGLVGLAPPGGLTGGRGNEFQPTLVGGAACFPADAHGELRPCNNTPPVFQAMMSEGGLAPVYGLWLQKPASSPSDNANKGVGSLVLGGVDPSLPHGPWVTTPLQPNLWRNDFYNSTDNFPFWQFNPLSIDLEMADGTVQNLCDSLANGSSLLGPNACVAIADTGYTDTVVGNEAARNMLQAATQANALVCGVNLRVRLPASDADTVGTTVVLQLTTPGSTTCGDFVNDNAWPPCATCNNTVFEAPPTKLQPYLPANWWVFSQPLLQQMYLALDFTANGGRGGLHFAPKATASKFSVVSINIAPSNDIGSDWPTTTALTVHHVQIGESNGLPIAHTIDSGSGAVIRTCGGQPWCGNNNTAEQFVPSRYWAGCAAGPTCGYNIPGFTLDPETVMDGVLSGGAGAGTCNWTVILEPKGSQSSGAVAQDSLFIFNAAPGTSTEAATGPPAVAALNDALIACFWIGDTASASNPNACTLPTFVNPQQCQTNRATEAGHDRSLSAVPTMLFNAGAVSYDAWAMCQYNQSESFRGACGGTPMQNSYNIYGNAWPTGYTSKDLQTVPLLTNQQLAALVADGSLPLSAYNQSRMLTRYLARVGSFKVSWTPPGAKKATTQTVKLTPAEQVVNLDTGAYAAMQVDQDTYNIFVQAVHSQVKALNGSAGGYTILPCPTEGNTCQGGNGNQDPIAGCLAVSVPVQANAALQQAEADKAAAWLSQVFPSVTATFADSGAVATFSTALPTFNCQNTMVTYCSYPSPTGSNGGIPTPQWWANPFFNDRFVQFDRAANVVRFSKQGVNACAGGFQGIA